MHVLFAVWRDTANPEGGGSERYVEAVAAGLVERGHRVTIASAAFPGCVRTEVVDGIRFVRRGSKLDIYLLVFLRLLVRRYGRVDHVVDVQNGLPFFTRLATTKPVTVLVHHVHREQWPVVYPGLLGRLGWFLESRVAPWLYRTCGYVAVSRATRDELVSLGVEPERIAIVHNGTAPVLEQPERRSPSPRLCVVGRLVPHKQVEHAIDLVADLSAEFPELELDIVGDGWWREELLAHARKRGVSDRVHLLGFVTEAHKDEVYARSWAMVLPSLKEGWGIVIGEAGLHRTPTVAYRSAGGPTESIDDKSSGLLVDSQDELLAATAGILRDREWRDHLGDGAHRKAGEYSWDQTRRLFAEALGA